MIDSILLGSIRRGSEDALERLINKYYAYVCVVIINAAGNRLTREDIEEAVSDVFFALWESADRVQKVKPWLGATARHKARNKLRELRDELPLDYEIAADDDRSALEDAIISNSEKAAVKTAILAMDAPDREIFLRHYYGSQTTAVISEEIGISESAVKQRLVRGRKKLRLILEQEGLGE
jgi:RNA polymerase sigma-70 factor (ECF subfamily)